MFLQQKPAPSWLLRKIVIVEMVGILKSRKHPMVSMIWAMIPPLARSGESSLSSCSSDSDSDSNSDSSIDDDSSFSDDKSTSSEGSAPMMMAQQPPPIAFDQPRWRFFATQGVPRNSTPLVDASSSTD